MRSSKGTDVGCVKPFDRLISAGEWPADAKVLEKPLPVERDAMEREVFSGKGQCVIETDEHRPLGGVGKTFDKPVGNSLAAPVCS